MKKIIAKGLVAQMALGLILAYLVLAPFTKVRALVANSTASASAPPQNQGTRPIRTLPALEEIRVWLGGSGANFSFGSNHSALSVRLNVLDNFSFDMKPFAAPGLLDAYDIFYSNADGTLNADGAYLTIEAVSNSQAERAGGGNVAEIGLRFLGSTTFEYGITVESFVALGSNQNPTLNSNAVDGNIQTFARLGNTVGQSQRLRITIGFASSAGPPPTSLPTLSIEDVEVLEGRTGTTNAVFSVTLSVASSSQVTVGYSTADGTAKLEDNDYTITSGTLTFPAGDNTPKLITVPVIGDRRDEPDEIFLVNLSNPVGANISDGNSVCTIIDDDGLPSLYINDASVTEGNDGDRVNAVFSVRLSRPSSSIVTVDYATADGVPAGDFSATVADNDYVSTSGTLTFPANSAMPLTISVTIIGDTRPEFNERFLVTLSNPHNARFGDEIGVGRILSDSCTYGIDPPSIRSFSGEGGDMGSFTVTTSSPECLWRVINSHSPGPDIRFSPREGSGTRTVSFSLNPNRSSFPLFDQILILDFQSDTVGSFSIVQSGRLCIPDNQRIHFSEGKISFNGGTYGFELSGPVGCQIQARSNSEWIGNVVCRNSIGDTGALCSFFAGKNNGAGRTGNIVVNGIGLTVEQEGCPISEIVISTSSNGSPSSNLVESSHNFRDKVLAQTSRGQNYIRLYYQFSPESVRLLMFNPMLMLRSRDILERYEPVVEAMVKGEPVTLSSGDLDDIDSFLTSFAAKGSPELQQAVKGVCEDLRDPHVQGEFHITIVEGTKREISSLSPLHINRQAVGAVASMSLFLGLIYCFSGGRGKRRRVKAKRLLCALLVFLLSQSASGFSLRSVCGPRLESKESSATLTESAARKQAILRQDRLPLRFEANDRQGDSRVGFLSRGAGLTLSLSPTEATMNLRKQRAEGEGHLWRRPQPTADHRPPATALSMKLIEANPSSQMTGFGRLPATTNYFTGKDPARWRTGVPAYAGVKCEQLYPGIDMVYYGNQRQLEYDFIVAPGADPEAIKLRFDGARSVEIDRSGELVLRAEGGEIRQPAPFVYQEVAGVRRMVASRYTLNEKRLIGFELGAYDKTIPLIIDPVLAYSTYLGGSGDDEGTAIAVDSSGNAYVIGFTESVDFPTFRPSQPSFGGGQQDLFVAKLNRSGQLVYSTYLGGDSQDNGTAIGVDSAGNAYITGYTNSTDFPVLNAVQPAKGGPYNAFVAKLDPGGSLLYSTHLGGSAQDFGSSIAVDSSGNVYVAGVATSEDFPVINSIQASLGGAADVYVAKLNPKGEKLIYSTYLGGAGDDGAASVAVDSAGSVYLAGVTSSPDFPTSQALQSSHGGGILDGFVAKVNPSGTELVYSTYLGGSGEDRASRIAVDSSGNAYVTGDTDSVNFPLVSAAQQGIGGRSDAFVAKLSPSGTKLVYSTYLGGSRIDGGTAIAVSEAGAAYITGFTSSTDFPLAAPLQQSLSGGGFDGFIASLNTSGSGLIFSTYLGGNGIDAGFAVAVDSKGDTYVMGQTDSVDFPTMNAAQVRNGGGASDVFIAKIVAGPVITAVRLKGKHLVVTGSGFEQGAVILLNGESQRTRFESANSLKGKQLALKIAPGATVRLQVKNPDKTTSNEFDFVRPPE